MPELLIEKAPRAHIGSLDVDIALNHRTLQEVGYRTILKLLLSHGYCQSEQPFIFFRTVQIGERQIEVEVDFLAGEYYGTTRSHRTQKVQDMRPRKARGCDLALSLATEIRVSGTLPGGAKDTATLRVASIVPFLVMKAMALASRLMEKDSWDFTTASATTQAVSTSWLINSSRIYPTSWFKKPLETLPRNLLHLIMSGLSMLPISKILPAQKTGPFCNAIHLSVCKR